MSAPEIQYDGAQARITPTTDIVAASVPELRAALRELLGRQVRELVIDLTRVQMVDSAGIGLLIAAHNSLSRVSGRLSVVNTSADLSELFRSVRLNQHFRIETSEGVVS